MPSQKLRRMLTKFFAASLSYAMLWWALTALVFWVVLPSVGWVPSMVRPLSSASWATVHEKDTPPQLMLFFLLGGLALAMFVEFGFLTKRKRLGLWIWYLASFVAFTSPQAIWLATEWGSADFWPRVVLRALLTGPCLGLFFAWVALRIAEYQQRS